MSTSKHISFVKVISCRFKIVSQTVNLRYLLPYRILLKYEQFLYWMWYFVCFQGLLDNFQWLATGLCPAMAQNLFPMWASTHAPLRALSHHSAALPLTMHESLETVGSTMSQRVRESWESFQEILTIILIARDHVSQKISFSVVYQNTRRLA